MACNDCNYDHPTNKCPAVNFHTDGTYLVPETAGVVGEGIDLERIVKLAETPTRLQLDPIEKRLSYTGEKATDVVSIAAIASLMELQDFLDVAEGFPSPGDILIRQNNKWVPYTIPVGTALSQVGIDSDGMLVKSESDGEPVPGGGGATLPIGSTMIWPGAEETVPLGWMHQSGQELSRTVYAELFNLIGTKYGAGNGTTTFNIPNTRGRTVVGRALSGQFDQRGAAPGSETVTLTVPQLPNHTHGVFDPGHNHVIGNNVVVVGASTLGLANGPHERISYGGTATSTNGTGISIYGTGNNQPHNNVQPSMVEYYIMRVI